MISKEQLVFHYVESGKSSRSIAEEFNISKSTVLNLLRKHGIKPNTYHEDFLERTFGQLKVLEYAGSGWWVCLCTCGKKKKIRGSHLKSSSTTSCGCLRQRIGSSSPLWKGHGEISASLFKSYELGAKRRNLPFEITIEYAWNIFQSQKRICPFTGLSLSIKRKGGTASIDRIDPRLGYVVGNIQWVHKRINEMKWDYPKDEFLHWCKTVTDHSKRSND